MPAIMQRQLWAGAQRPSTGGSRSPSKTNLTGRARTDKLDTARPNYTHPKVRPSEPPLCPFQQTSIITSGLMGRRRRSLRYSTTVCFQRFPHRHRFTRPRGQKNDRVEHPLILTIVRTARLALKTRKEPTMIVTGHTKPGCPQCRAIYEGAPWITKDSNHATIDPEALVVHTGAWSGESIASFLLGGEPADLAEDIPGLDRCSTTLDMNCTPIVGP